GFDTDGAVREAWQFARLGVIHADSLAPVAAAQGLPDALNLAVAHVQSIDGSDARKQALENLASLTGYTGPKNETFAWLAANLQRFQFDPAQHRYIIGQPQ